MIRWLTFYLLFEFFRGGEINSRLGVAVWDGRVSTMTEKQSAHLHPEQHNNVFDIINGMYAMLKSHGTNLDFEAASCSGVNCHRSRAFTLAPLCKYHNKQLWLATITS